VLVEHGDLVSVDEGSGGTESLVVEADDVIRLVAIGGDGHAGTALCEGLHDFAGLRTGAAGERAVVATAPDRLTGNPVMP